MCQGRRSRLWQKRAIVLGAVLLLGWSLLPRSPSSAHHTQHFPTIRPDILAHYLADFSNHALLYPQLNSWTIESDWSNVTSWRYEVTYTCGGRCVGRAVVTASKVHESGVLHHGAVRRHRVLTLDAHCTPLLPVLPWPAVCEETETVALIVGQGETGLEGSQLTESTSTRCSALASLLSRCAGVAEMASRRRMQLHALKAALVTTE